MKTLELSQLVNEVIPLKRKRGLVSFEQLYVSQDPTDKAIALAVNEYLSPIWRKSLVDAKDPSYRRKMDFMLISQDLNLQYTNLKSTIGEDLFQAFVAFGMNTMGKCEESSRHLYNRLSENYPGLNCTILRAYGGLSYFREHYVLLIERSAYETDQVDESGNAMLSPATSWVVSPNNFIRFMPNDMYFCFIEQYNSVFDCIKITATAEVPNPSARAIRILSNLEGSTGSWQVIQSTKTTTES